MNFCLDYLFFLGIQAIQMWAFKASFGLESFRVEYIGLAAVDWRSFGQSMGEDSRTAA